MPFLQVEGGILEVNRHCELRLAPIPDAEVAELQEDATSLLPTVRHFLHLFSLFLRLEKPSEGRREGGGGGGGGLGGGHGSAAPQARREARQARSLHLGVDVGVGVAVGR